MFNCSSLISDAVIALFKLCCGNINVVCAVKADTFSAKRNINTFPAIRRLGRSAKTSQLEKSYDSVVDYDYVLENDHYLSPTGYGTDRVYILEGDSPSSATVVNKNSLNNIYNLNSAAVFTQGYGANSRNINNGFSSTRTNNGWNGGTDYFSYLK